MSKNSTSSSSLEVIVQNTRGVPIYRCSDKQARHYIRKGYARWDGDQLRLLDDSTEKRLIEMYGTLNNPFFLAQKEERCVVCGSSEDLTKHHVIPRRHIKKISPEIRKRLCNTLCVCRKCHDHYEKYSSDEPFGDVIKDPVVYAILWRDHFINFMQPQFLPPGWDIIMKIPEEYAI